jgi:hypothetical protein
MATLVVIGGGCYGSHHARRLLRSMDRAAPAGHGGHRLVVVDRDVRCQAAGEFAVERRVSLVRSDWLDFLREWLPSAAPDDHLIPAPLAPHLLWEWLGASLALSPAPPPRGWGLPYEVAGPGQELYLSAAAWICPATCTEPRHCPALHAPRDWDLARIIEARARELGCRPAIFPLGHVAGGVAGIRAGRLQEVLAALGDGDAAAPVLVATSSHCHAAVGLLRASGPTGLR